MTTQTPYQPPPVEALVRLDEVLKRIPVSRSSYYAGQAKGIYPQPVSIGPRARAYRFSDVLTWLQDPEKWRQEHSKPKEGM